MACLVAIACVAGYLWHKHSEGVNNPQSTTVTDTIEREDSLDEDVDTIPEEPTDLDSQEMEDYVLRVCKNPTEDEESFRQLFIDDLDFKPLHFDNGLEAEKELTTVGEIKANITDFISQDVEDRFQIDSIAFYPDTQEAGTQNAASNRYPRIKYIRIK